MAIPWKYVAAYGAYVLALHAVEGPWRRWKVGYEGAAVDPWTLTHALWGAIAHRMGVSRSQLLVLSAANEGAEWATRTFRPDLLWGTPETSANVGVDLVATLAGWELARLVGRPGGAA